MCVCAHIRVFALREREASERSVFALLCGELSIVAGAESGLQLPT